MWVSLTKATAGTTETRRTRGKARGVVQSLVLLGVLGASVVSSSCASLARAALSEPVVTLRNVQVTGLGLQGGSLNVELGVYNPNGISLRAVALTYNVFVDSTRLASGAAPTEYDLKGGDTTVVTLPVSFTYAGVGAAVQQMLGRGSVNYRVAGDIGVRTPAGTLTRPYNRTGTYAMRR
jgi:LEA14-like dessication related protein